MPGFPTNPAAMPWWPQKVVNSSTTRAAILLRSDTPEQFQLQLAGGGDEDTCDDAVSGSTVATQAGIADVLRRILAVTGSSALEERRLPMYSGRGSLSAENQAEAVLDLAKYGRADAAEGLAQPFAGDGAHILALGEARMLETALRRVNADVERGLLGS